MEQLSFFEKLGILWQNILAHPIFICILLLPVALIFFNKKITKKAVVLIYIGILAIVLFVGNTTIFALFDNVVDNIFMALYFPNFITLFIVEIISAIITLVTFIKKDITKSRKIINITSFVIIQMLFTLILTVIQTNEIDIYEENALYSSNDVLTLMQLLMGTFGLQVLTLLVIYGIDKVTNYLDAKEHPQNHITHARIEPEIKVIVKEPEIKLPKTKPVKPLDKKLIEKVKLSPLDLDEEINKEKQRKHDAIPKTAVETLDMTKPSELLRQKIEQKKELIAKEEVKPKTIIQEKLQINDEKVKKPDLLKPEVIPVGELKKEEPKWTVDSKTEIKQKEKPKQVENNLSFADFKPEYPDVENNTTSMTPNIKENPNIDIIIPETPVIKPKTVDTVKPQNVVDSKPEVTERNSKELITNLVIINFPKTVSAVKNLKTVYTL